MRAIIFSRSWYATATRIALLVVLGWWALQAGGWFARAAAPYQAQWPQTDFSRAAVDLVEITSGGPPKDGIPAVDNPQFVSAAEPIDWLDPREPVISVEIDGDARAYPLQILIYHEIVNDTVGGTPVAVTFCPLCNASLVFDRRVEGELLDFGTTGMLRKSDLVMYDRQSESWWQQFTGTAIVGAHTGKVLTQIPSSIVAFGDFVAGYPGGKVLTRRTGFIRPYGRNPYRGYDAMGNLPFLLDDPVDERLPAMERVIGVSHKGRNRIYPFAAFRDQPVINDEFEGIPLVVFSKEGTLSVLDRSSIRESREVPAASAYRRELDGDTLHFEVRDAEIRDRETGSRWDLFGRCVAGPLRGKRLEALPGGVHFAFAWLAFRPDTEIYSR